MPDYSNWNTVEVTYSLLCFILCSLRFAKAEDERAAGTEWAKDHGHLSGNGPEALEMKGLTRPNQMVNDDVIICRLTYMKKPFILFRNI